MAALGKLVSIVAVSVLALGIGALSQGTAALPHLLDAAAAGSSRSAAALSTESVQVVGTRVVSGSTGDTTKALYTVPDGKRLVIEFASARLGYLDPDSVIDVGMSVGNGPIFWIPMSGQQGRGDSSDFVGSTTMRLYASAGQQIYLHGVHEDTTDGVVTISFSGFLAKAG